jgi:hypothetical protein
MRRLVVLLGLCAGLGALALVACGGNDKPPLMPDSVDTSIPGDSPDAAPPPATTAKPGK